MNKCIITIGREFGSGGHEIGKRLARSLKIPFYDREILTLTAQEGDMKESDIAENEEQMPVGRLFQLSMRAPFNPPVTDEVFVLQQSAIKKLAQNGPCVIVGRCADFVLRDEDIVRVFISADMPYKIARKRMIAPENCEYSEEEMRKYISEVNENRRKYYEYHTRSKWGHSEHYDLCIRTDHLGVDGAVRVILAYLENARA